MNSMAERTASDVSTLLKTIRFSDHELSALWIRLGSIYEKTNKFDQALSAYMRCIEADGDNPVPLYRFVFICRAHRVTMLTHCLKLLGIHFLTFLTEYESTRQAAVDDWILQVERDEKREKEKQLLKNSNSGDGGGDKEKGLVGRRDRDLTEEDMFSASSGIRALEDDPTLGPNFVLQNRGISIRRPIARDRRIMGRKRGRTKAKPAVKDTETDKNNDNNDNNNETSPSKKQKTNDDDMECNEKTNEEQTEGTETVGKRKGDSEVDGEGKKEEVEEEEEDEEYGEDEEEEEEIDTNEDRNENDEQNDNDNNNNNNQNENSITNTNDDTTTTEQVNSSSSSSGSSDLFTFPAPLAPMSELNGSVDHTAVHYGVGGWAGVDDDDFGYDMIADIARENEEEEGREGRDKVEGHLQGPDSGEKVDGVDEENSGEGVLVNGEESNKEGVKEGDVEGEGEGEGEAEGGRREGARPFATSTLGTRKFPRHMIENELRAIAMWAVLLRESGKSRLLVLTFIHYVS